MAVAKTSPTIEDYLLTIYFMNRDSIPTISARLAERIGVSAPTVTATLQRMVRDGLVEMRAHKEIDLTDAGRSLAEDMVRRHALAERLLTDILGMSWDDAHAEAHLIEHAISGKVEQRLYEVLGRPQTCPHGNPMPGYEAELTGIPLDAMHEGQEVIVERITEDAESEPALLQYLQKHGLQPGARLRVKEVVQFNEMLTLEAPNGEVALGFSAAAKIRVNPVSKL